MFYNKKSEDILNELNTSKHGLSLSKVEKNISKYGLNILPSKKKDSVIKIFFSEFKDPMIILLLCAILASVIVKEYVDALAILLIILVDIIMGTYQENKANNTAEALEKLIKVKTKVIREGKLVEIESSEITVGDYLLLESGDKIPADLRIIESHNLMVDESILTGESMQVSKNSEIIEKNNIPINEQDNMLFSGTNIVTGRASAVVVAVGLSTEIGKIANSINNAEDTPSPLTIRVEKFSKQISALILLIAAIITMLLIVQNVPYHEIFLSVIALAVSAMPEGLPLALTMALTIGSNKMAKNNVIVKKLNAVESLGSCTIIASDKTGTLTVNEQMAKKIILPDDSEYDITGSGYDLFGKIKGDNIEKAQEIALLGVINNEAFLESMNGDSIDLAFLVLGKKANVTDSGIKILEVIPYESENKYSAVFYEKDNEVYCTVKGSFETIVGFCSRGHMDKIATQNEKLAKEGYRVITLANGKINKKTKYNEKDIKKLTFMGMVGFIDPIRKDAIKAIRECKNAGIKVLMITGDHPLTAYSIAKELELTSDYGEVTTGDEVSIFLRKSHSEFDNFVKSKKVFTRVTPLQKLEIVESLKRQGEFVAVTGDGVNDAPALKSANIGVAMGSGTDIARETADMIIIDDNFKSIVQGVKEGRVAYANIRKIILFLISCGLSEVLFFCLAIIFNLPMPLVAIQLLWINVVTDGIQDFALSFEKAEKGIMTMPPRNPKESLFDKEILGEIVVSGMTVGIIVFGTWAFLINVLKMDLAIARAYIMALMVFVQNIHVFNCRSEKSSAFSISLKSNKIIIWGVMISILLQIIIMESSVLAKFLHISSIPIVHLLYLFLISLFILVVLEIYKKVRFK